MNEHKINFGGFPKIIKIDNELKIKIEFTDKINNKKINSRIYNTGNNDNMNFLNILNLKKIKND